MTLTSDAPFGVTSGSTAPETLLNSGDGGADGALPSLTAIMPTRDRRAFVAQALRYFTRQDYPHADLIVVDDGYDAVGDLVERAAAELEPRGREISYIRLGSPHSIGAKRNLACARARGDIIAHWDDDDWSAPDRLRRQVTSMLAAGADLCGLSDVLRYRPLRGDAWRRRDDTDRQIAGASVVYRRSVWEEAGFPDVSRGEDSSFVGRLPVHRVLALPDQALMIAVVHGRNVSSLSIGTPSWRPVPLDEVAALLGADRNFYSVLRGGPAVAERPRAAAGTPISVVAAFDVFSGYGGTAEYLALSLARAGATVTAAPLGLVPHGLSEELLAMIHRAPVSTNDQPTIYHSWLRRDVEPFVDGRELFISTMWEANRFPPAWVTTLQQARAVIVPSTFVADSCRASGVTRPIVVVPLGVDPDVYSYQPRPHPDGLTTLIVAPVDERKHTHLAIEAWKVAFAGDPSARLVIKTTYGYHNYVPDDPRIIYIDQVELNRGIVDYYRKADILMALGSEGFGLPLVEGMATGLPVIALNAEGQADVCRDAGDRVLAVPAAGRELHANHIVGPAGYRSTPDFGSVVKHLRWVDQHRDDARALGQEASAWVTENRNLWSFGAGVLDVIGRTSARTRRTVLPRTLWVPTLGTACGIAETTARLQRNLPSVRLTKQEPPIGVSGIVHVQHEPSIIDDRRLERFTAQARERGLAVAVTENSVFDRPSPWERNVQALVTTTTAGAALLRQRHPNLRVVVIPLGCETWAFPRKESRGRTIGFFGFPGPHKGLDRLGRAVRRLPDCEVVLYAHHPNPHPPGLADWPIDIPPRWERQWLPLPQIAAQLAAETDVLVFPYDEVAHRSASSAALVGLSTGVPVLTSDTTWFADLGPAVHRYVASGGPGSSGDDSALADALEQLLDDDALRNETTAAAREYCVAHSWSRIAARHVDLWNSFESV